MNWKIRDARNKLSEVIRRALTEGPQRIERRGEVVVVLSEAEYARLVGQKPRLVDALRRLPDSSELDLERRRE